MNFFDTVNESLLSDFYPRGWDMQKIDKCCVHPPESILERQYFWNSQFFPVRCDNVECMAMMMGHEIANVIRTTKEDGRPLVLMLPADPLGMYQWTVYFLQQWHIDCKHVHSFSISEWSDKDGNTIESDNKASFQHAIQQAFYSPLKELTVPVSQRNFATQNNLPKYPEKIAALKAKGARLVTIYGIGRMMNIGFWEPQFASEFASEEEWKAQTFRKGAKLHPLTVEQNAVIHFKSRTTLVPCFANTIGPGIFLQSDYTIGGCDGILGGGVIWQGMSLWTTLRYGSSVWVPSSVMPTLPGKLFFQKDLAGPLEA